MEIYTEDELKIISKLADNKGYPEWELVEELKFDKHKISKLINKLEKKKVIYCESRKTTRIGSHRPNSQEKVSYIIPNIDIFYDILFNLYIKNLELFFKELSNRIELEKQNIVEEFILESKRVDLPQFSIEISDYGITLKNFVYSNYYSCIIKDYGIDAAQFLNQFFDEKEFRLFLENAIKKGLLDDEDEVAISEFYREKDLNV